MNYIKDIVVKTWKKYEEFVYSPWDEKDLNIMSFFLSKKLQFEICIAKTHKYVVLKKKSVFFADQINGLI